MLSSPLNLKSNLHPPNFRMNVVPFVDALLITLCLFMLGSRFISAPGVTVDLPKVSNIENRSVVSVLTIRHDKMLIYEGRIYTINEISDALAKSVNGLEADRVLLVKLNKDVTMQTFLNICDIARGAGITQVQVASESKAPLQ